MAAGLADSLEYSLVDKPNQGNGVGFHDFVFEVILIGVCRHQLLTISYRWIETKYALRLPPTIPSNPGLFFLRTRLASAGRPHLFADLRYVRWCASFAGRR